MVQIQKHKPYTLTLILVIIGVVFFVFAFFNPSEYSFFYACPIQKTTGYFCAGCGAQRALHQLLHFNYLEAFRLNSLFVISLPFLCIGGTLKVSNLLFKKKYRFPLFYNNKFIIVCLIVIVLFAILRNIPCEPFLFLAPN